MLNAVKRNRQGHTLFTVKPFVVTYVGFTGGGGGRMPENGGGVFLSSLF